MKQLEIIEAALRTVSDSVFLSMPPLEKNCPYFVYDFDNTIELQVNNRVLEQAIQGTIDLYSENPTDPLFFKVQTALRKTGVAWYFNTKQIEDDRDPVVFHYEWVWSHG